VGRGELPQDLAAGLQPGFECNGQPARSLLASRGEARGGWLGARRVISNCSILARY
jgi:hypothetical protein